MGELLIRDRRSGAVFPERVFGGDALDRLYGTAHGRLLRRLLRTRPFNQIYGAWKRRRGSREEIPRFVESLGIDATEAELPLDRYESLDAFFERRLQPGARPVEADPSRLVAPVDARALAFPACEALTVKRSRVELPVLLGDAALARRFAGGAAFVFRLAPADYHRFHFPVDGVAGPSRRLPGGLESVHPIALAAGARSFENQRDVTLLETARFGTLAMVEVGALLVGTILQTYRPGAVARGAEKGTFRFGGSTVVLLAEPGRVRIDDDLISTGPDALEVLVRMGSSIGAAGA